MQVSNRSFNRPRRRQGRRGLNNSQRSGSTNLITSYRSDAFAPSKDVPRTIWNGAEGGPRANPILGLVTNSFIPAFGKLSYQGCLRYGASSLDMTSSTGSVGSYIFSANGLFDPNITGGALQPAGFSQLMLSYDHYTVRRSRASVTFTNNGPNPACVSLRLDSDDVALTDPPNLLEQPQANITFLEPSGVYGSTRTLVMDCDVEKLNGLRRGSILSDPVFRGDVLSNPQEQSYFHCGIFGTTGSAASCKITVVIDYWATFQEPRELNPSLQSTFVDLVKRDARHKKLTEVAKDAKSTI